MTALALALALAAAPGSRGPAAPPSRAGSAGAAREGHVRRAPGEGDLRVGGRILPVDPRRAPPLPLHHVHRGDTLRLRLFDADGTLRPAALATLRAFLTDPRSGIDHPIHWRLATLLVAVAAHFPGATLQVVSGFRARSRHTLRSRHTRGRALDFRVPGVPNRALVDLLRRSFRGVGVGYYPNSTFVHLDVREHDAVWVDYSGPGEAPCYSPSPARDLADGTAGRLTSAQARARGCRGGSRRPDPAPRR